MSPRSAIDRLLQSRRVMLGQTPHTVTDRSQAAEGGCGVIGIACSEPIPGRHLLQSLRQMRNRGNGKGGGAAMVGLAPDQLGVTPEMLRDDYLLAVAYLDPGARAEVERSHIEQGFEIDHVHEFPLEPPKGLSPKPPLAVGYFVRVKTSALEEFADRAGLHDLPLAALEDEWVYQNTFKLNAAYYASLGDQRAFVLSHGKDMLALKMVGFGDDVIETYRLEDQLAHVWIGHHRYPTKGKVWHPGGAHPFVGMHEALVHNGDFANYASVCSYLAQHSIEPLFLTDTEVSVLVFDLLHRTFGYPLEHVIEALAPTTERDFAMLPEAKKSTYRQLQAAHIHGSPDGPWFFLIAQSAADGDQPRKARLLGITDTSMLRPQVFALQRGEPGMPSVGLAASEKQAIDAALTSLSSQDDRFWDRPDKLWVARGGSHTDGGAFLFEVERGVDGARLNCTDKFGRPVDLDAHSEPYRNGRNSSALEQPGEPPMAAWLDADRDTIIESVSAWDYTKLSAYLGAMVDRASEDPSRRRALEILSALLDRRYPTGAMRRSSILSMIDRVLDRLFDDMHRAPSPGFVGRRAGEPTPDPVGRAQTLLIDGSGFAPEGDDSLARAVVEAVDRGFRRIVVWGAMGHRFLGNGLGPRGADVRLDIYGSPGDYLASGMDGIELVVHNNGQDQLAQIMKGGTLVVHGDVGQTFMYAAKGGRAFVLGSAAGRPLINAVGSPRVVINGTCLDYLAESFMAGDPFQGGGFVVVNGLGFDDQGQLEELDSPYPGGNLFSLASGGAIFIRDPYGKVGPDQLNGGALVPFGDEHWTLIEPLLKENAEWFGLPVDALLTVDGEVHAPAEVYRAIVPVRQQALQPEQAWVGKH